MTESVRYQYYRSRDGIVLLMASEREFWKNFAYGVGRPELYEQQPGAKYADHARGNTELRAILRDIFASRSSAEWLDFGMKHNTPIAPSNRPCPEPSFFQGSVCAPKPAPYAVRPPPPVRFR